MNRLRPLPGGGGQLGHSLHQLDTARIAGSEQHLCQMERQVGVDSRVDDVQEEATFEEAVFEQVLRGLDDA
jgi:hypothetical protein